MAIEIREMVVAVDVDHTTPLSGSSGAGSSVDADLVNACVEKVMEILERQKER